MNLWKSKVKPLKLFKNLFNKQNTSPKYLHTNFGGKFANKAFQNYIAKKNIK